MDFAAVRWAYVPDLDERVGQPLDGGTRGWWHVYHDDAPDDEGNRWFLIFAFRPGEVEEVCAAAVECAPEHAPTLLSWADEPPEGPPDPVPAWLCFDGPAPALVGFPSEEGRFAAEMVLQHLAPFEERGDYDG